MKPAHRIFVVGGAHSPYVGKGHPRPLPSIEDHMRAAVLSALEGSRVPASAIQKGFVGNFLGECFARQGHLGAMLAAVHPDLDGKPLGRVEAACASGGLAVLGCIESMHAGYDVTLAVGVEVECTVKGTEGVEFVARAAHYAKQRHIEPALFPWLFARRIAEYGATRADLDAVVAKAYSNASLNPYAQQRDVDPPSGERNRHFLQDETLRPHIRMSDCTQFTDGASAVVLATEAGLARLGRAPAECTEIVAYAHHTRALDGEVDPTRLVNVGGAAKEAYDDAGLGPDDLDVAEIHDCFSITELQMYEALGFGDDARQLIHDGVTHLGGRLPVNTGGGLLGFGHPIGATGVKQVLEVHRQMRGQCGDYQLPTAPRVGIAANLGGDDRTAVVTIQTAG